jgi:hypothetical protein
MAGIQIDGPIPASGAIYLVGCSAIYVGFFFFSFTAVLLRHTWKAYAILFGHLQGNK